MPTNDPASSPGSWELASGEVRVVSIDGLVLRARLVDKESFPACARVFDGLGGFALSLVVHALVMVLLVALSARTAGEEPDAERAVMRRLLAASDSREVPKPSTPRRAPPASSMETRPSMASNPSAPAAGAQRYAGPSPSRRATAKAEATGFGMIGLLQAMRDNPPPPTEWNRTTSLDGDADRVNAMFRESVGEAPGALALSGTGLGGGGKGAAFDIRGRSVLATRTDERLQSADTGSFAHVADTRGTVEPNDGPPPIQPIPRPVIERIVATNAGRFRICLGLGQRKNPKLAGRVDVAFTIGAGGHVTEAHDAGGNLDDDVVRACVVRTFMALAFPPPMRGVPQTTTLPIELHP